MTTELAFWECYTFGFLKLLESLIDGNFLLQPFLTIHTVRMSSYKSLPSKSHTIINLDMIHIDKR